MSIDQYADQPDLPTGWAIRKADGLISIRTASYRPEAAKINALVLFGGLNSWASAHYSDAQINSEYAELAERLGLELVEVECVPRS